VKTNLELRCGRAPSEKTRERFLGGVLREKECKKGVKRVAAGLAGYSHRSSTTQRVRAENKKRIFRGLLIGGKLMEISNQGTNSVYSNKKLYPGGI